MGTHEWWCRWAHNYNTIITQATPLGVDKGHTCLYGKCLTSLVHHLLPRHNIHRKLLLGTHSPVGVAFPPFLSFLLCAVPAAAAAGVAAASAPVSGLSGPFSLCPGVAAAGGFLVTLLGAGVASLE